MKTPVSTVNRFACLTSLLLLVSPAAHAVLIAYEGFDYSPGLANNALINTAPNGGTGFTSGFTSSNVNYSSTGLTSAVAGTVTVPIGGAIRFDPSDNLTQRAWGTMTTAPADGTYWYSFLFRPLDSTSSGSGGRGTFNIMSATNSTNGQDGVGLRLDNANSGADLLFKALSPTGGSGSDTNFVTVAGGYGSTYLIVGRVDINSTTGSTNRIWVNPSKNVVPLDADNNSVSVSISATDTGNLRSSLAGRAFGTGTGSALFVDEVRIGTTVNDVMLIPEPSAALLGLLGAVGLLRRRR